LRWLESVEEDIKEHGCEEEEEEQEEEEVEEEEEEEEELFLNI
jgi:hypothetical protein